MFSQRKRFYQRKSFYGIVFALLLAFGFWINQDPGTQGTQGVLNDPVINTGEPIPTENQTNVGSNVPLRDSSNWRADDIVDGGSDQNPLTETEIPSDTSNGDFSSDEEIAGPCYLVKEDDGYIKIYSVDEAGAQQLVRTTDISFSLLGEGDQELFRKGIVKETKDELSDLLQDFES